MGHRPMINSDICQTATKHASQIRWRCAVDCKWWL